MDGGGATQLTRELTELPPIDTGKMMSESWNDCSEFSKLIFKELAEEGRKVYVVKMAEYTAGQSREESSSKTESSSSEKVPQIDATTILAKMKNDMLK
jgi:hypothetical protein|eukprot:scaffold4733_cov170-Alexandrium_tamarense.AAC.41